MAHEAEALAEGYVTTWAGPVRVTASPAGVRTVWLPDWHDRDGAAGLAASATRMSALGAVRVRARGEGAAEEQLRRALEELAEYFAGERQAFTVALDLRGPAFHQRAWEAVARVPYGETRTYGEIARDIGEPQAARAVGAANGANPVAPIVPCHRIIGSDGRLTGYGPGLPLKERLLVMEGALPDGPDGYTAWVRRLTARAGGQAPCLGVRAEGVFCAPECARARRWAARPARIFRDATAASAAGFRPCPACRGGVEAVVTAQLWA